MVKKKVVFGIPVLNEEAVIPELLRRLHQTAINSSKYDFEFLFVDDGSTDGTFELLSRAASNHSKIQIIKFSRNFGHQAALSAAIDHAEGDLLILMDGDLQDPPELAEEFLKQHELGYDVVYAIRRTRQEPIWLRLSYSVFYRMVALLSNHTIPLDAGDCSLMTRQVVLTLRNFPERNRFVRGLRAWAGFRQIGVPVDRDERYAGTRKYTLTKLLRLAGDGLLSFSVVPLRAATLIGAIAILAAAVYSAYVVYVRVCGSGAPSGFSALLITNVFLSGVQLLFFGVIGEYVGRIYEEVKSRPHYVIEHFLKP